MYQEAADVVVIVAFGVVSCLGAERCESGAKLGDAQVGQETVAAVQLRREGAVSSAVRFNRDLMGWVIENLIKNGIDALKDGKGTITVKLSDRSEGGACMLVSDTGRGIPSRVGNKIFEPGFTTKKRGWGMGLALVKRIVEQYHGGRISVASTNRHGTTFQVLLPPAGELKPVAESHLDP